MIVHYRLSPGRRALPRWISNLLIAAGALMLIVVLWSKSESAFYQTVQTRHFEATILQPVATEPAAPESPSHISKRPRR